MCCGHYMGCCTEAAAMLPECNERRAIRMRPPAIETFARKRIVWPMAVLSTTLCYPSAAAPLQGVFVERRLAAISRRIPLAVVAPVPWFPFVRPMSFDPREQCSGTPPVWRPRMFYFPGLFKEQDAWFYERALLRACRHLKSSFDFQVIDAHFEWPDGVGAFHAARRLSVPFVCTLRGKLVSQARHPRKREKIAEMLRGADALMAVSASLAQLACEVARADLTVHVIPNGVDSIVFHRIDEGQGPAAPAPSLRQALGWPATARIAVSVGHLQELKGFHRLVAIWPAVRRQVGDARLVLVGGPAGEPNYEQRLNRQMMSLGLTEFVTLEGRVPQARVARILNAADLFVLASRSEGWCNAIAESLACGCPVVATDVGGNREIISDDRCGRLVDAARHESLESEVCRGLTARWDRRVIAEFGGRRSWQQVADECVDVLKGVMGSSSSRVSRPRRTA
ncbi:MAG: hypothetical protein DCC65_00375 [Planctomycetota bacterium]|nr:MAG: hypothetical protein DCC65_00375 [Planctomycetota bacterium]